MSCSRLVSRIPAPRNPSRLFQEETKLSAPRTRALMRALKICVSVISTSLAACDGTAENQVPISAAANYSIAENGTLSGQLHATDSDNDKITYAIANPPANGSVTMDGATGAFTYIPNQ